MSNKVGKTESETVTLVREFLKVLKTVSLKNIFITEPTPLKTLIEVKIAEKSASLTIKYKSGRAIQDRLSFLMNGKEKHIVLDHLSFDDHALIEDLVESTLKFLKVRMSKVNLERKIDGIAEEVNFSIDDIVKN